MIEVNGVIYIPPKTVVSSKFLGRYVRVCSVHCSSSTMSFSAQVRQLDDTHPEFDADLLVFFATEVAKVLAAVSGRTRVMVRGDELAGLATETLRVRMLPITHR